MLRTKGGQLIACNRLRAAQISPVCCSGGRGLSCPGRYAWGGGRRKRSDACRCSGPVPLPKGHCVPSYSLRRGLQFQPSIEVLLPWLFSEPALALLCNSPSPPNSYSSLTELLPILLGLLVLGCFFFFFQILILFMEGGVGKPSSICLSVYLAGLGNGTQGLCILSALPRLPSTAQ